MVPLGLFLWTAVIKPLLAWFRGEPVDNKAVKDKGEKTPDGEPVGKEAVKDKDEGEKTPDGSNQSTTTGKSEDQTVRYFCTKTLSGSVLKCYSHLRLYINYSSPCLQAS